MEKGIKYIFVDLDGTLVRTDVFLESVLKLIKQNPFAIFKLILWSLQGRSIVKEKVAKLVDIKPESLPYETELIDYLKEQKQQNKTIILATASNEKYANKIANYLGLFDQVIASNKQHNLKGKNKLSAILNIVGDKSFIYAGDHSADRPIWKEASANIFVNAPQRDIETAKTQGKVEKIIASRSTAYEFLKEMRVHQYAKNILIIVPLLTSHQYLDITSLYAAILAFLSFSLCASGVYFLNDMLDLDADRHHETKCNRPLASGRLSLPIGAAGAVGLPIIAFTLAWFLLPLTFFGVLLFYYILTSAYTFVLKRISTMDVMTLAILYTLRIVAGSAAIGVELSSWLIAFSVFIFVSLAYLKRYIEIASLSEGTEKAHGRGYSSDDAETMFILGVSNLTASVLVMALYINSSEVAALYRSPSILWGLCWLILYWGNRIWVGARRGKIADDPVVFAIKDRVSRWLGLAFVGVVIAAKYINF